MNSALRHVSILQARIVALLACVLFIPHVIFAQATPTDTTKPAPAPHLKELRPGVAMADSLYIPRDTVHGDVDTIVRYTAKDSTVFDVPNKRMILTTDAIVQYQNREMDANTIVMDFRQNTMTAYSHNFDSVVGATMGLRRKIIRDTNRTKVRGAPKLVDGGTTYEGEVILYNFKTKHGTVQMGTTEMEGGFYYGERIKEVAPQTLFVENGRYTTCDAPVPHYYFESPRMKVIMQDQIFAEPVYLYIADVPIFALPFGVFPNHGGGRHSGIIAPGYQTTGDRGYGLTHLGYYEVFSDYFDGRMQSDLFTKGGWNVDAMAEWNKRYLLNGAASLEVNYGKTRQSSVDPYSQTWKLDGNLPNLVLGYETSLTANLHFESNDFYQNNAHTTQDALTQQVTSGASFSTSWEDLGINLGIGYSRSQDLRQGTYDEESPSLNLSKSTMFPFALAEDNLNPSWIQTTFASTSIGYNLSANRHISHQRTNPTTDDPVDTSTYHTIEEYSVLHSPSISISPKAGHFTFTPSFSYQEAWLFHQHHRTNLDTAIVYQNATNTFDTISTYTTTKENGFYRLNTYSAALNVGTTLYGIANIGAFGLQAIRHTIIPNISLSYHPDLSYQNYDSFVDPHTHQKVFYNIFDGEPNGSLVGLGKSESMGLSLGNDFEAKVEHQVTKDSSTVDHVKLFHLDANSGYDLNSKIFSNLGLSAYTTIGTLFSLSGNAQYSFYPIDSIGNTLTDHTLLILHKGIVRPLAVSASMSGSFSSATTTEGDNYDSLRRQFNITTPDDERAFMLNGSFPGPFVTVPFRPKWNAGYNFNYYQSYSAQGIVHNVTANATLSLSLTKNWSFTTSAGYDLTNKQIVVPEIHVHRDLHCWEMDFSYYPPGSLLSGFNFVIRVKAPQLQDVKLTRQESSSVTFQ